MSRRYAPLAVAMLVVIVAAATIDMLRDHPSSGGVATPGVTGNAVASGDPVRRQTTYQGHGAEYWHWQAVKASRAAYQHWRDKRRLQRVLAQDPQVVEAINLACATYPDVDCRTLWRKAQCESQLDPGARNPSGASGLLQFLPSTWQTTPYARFSVWSPYANALAAAWMHSKAVGRSAEWACS